VKIWLDKMPAPKDPEKYKLWIKHMSEARKGRIVSEATRKKLSDANKGKGHPAWNKGIPQTDETKEKLSIAHTGKTLSEPHKKKISESGKGLKRSQITRDRISKSRTGIKVPYKTLEKMCEVNIGGFWYGNVRYYEDRNIYCEAWKDVNPRVHAFFNYKCCGCGIEENGKSHSGHHVFYEKKACCMYSTRDGIYHTNLNARDHPTKDYVIGENPNYFVILCPSCHGKTQGGFEIRKYWADHYKNLIDKQYGGKCYFTKEEIKEK